MGNEVEWDEGYGSNLLAEFKELAEAQKAESLRITGSARGAFALVAGFFAVAQTAALSSFNESSVGKHHQHLILHWAMGAAVCLAITGLLVLATSYLWKYAAVGPADLEKAADKAIDEDEDLAVILARRYQEQIENGETILARRRVLLFFTSVATGAALVATTIEIILALSFRL